MGGQCRPITSAAILRAIAALERLKDAPDFMEVFGLFDATVRGAIADIGECYRYVVERERARGVSDV